MNDRPYMRLAEAAVFLGWDKRTVENKMSTGVLKRGVHWFKRKGEMGPRFKREALIAFIECRDLPAEGTQQVSRSVNLLTLRRRQG